MSSLFSFPDFRTLQPYDKRFLKRLRSRIRYYFYRLQCYKECNQFVHFLNQNPQWLPIFEKVPYRCNAVLRKYCDTRFSKKARIQAILNNFELAEKFLGTSIVDKLAKQNHILLSELPDGLRLYLNINSIDPFEGFLSINIKNQDNESVYDSSFTFLSPNQLLIASIQGPNEENSQQLVKSATKSLHGIRPMFMIVNVFKLLSQLWDCELIAIAHKNQSKYRWNDFNRLLFNYDEFWQENNGKLNTQGYWALPLEIERKSLEEIQSKKRSMYRKRYEMLDKLETDLSAVFN
ncbi:VirK/YbjX family protein [Avibacterium gallinarum]|uniref:VirK/YbjX family protein n=1 Tax=Avibacterium gallinarum TaxID=755 RepID=UPI003BF8393A